MSDRQRAEHLFKTALQDFQDPAADADAVIQRLDAANDLLGASDPDIRAQVLLNLGLVHRHARRDAHELEQALSCLRRAESLSDPEVNREHWGRLQNALGVVWHERLQGEPQENERKAIAALLAALEVRTAEREPLDRAATLCNLANVHGQHFGEQRAWHTEQALDCYDEALTLVSVEAGAIRSAILFNRATVLLDHAGGDRAENLQRAVADLEQALELGMGPSEGAAAKLALANALGQGVSTTLAEDIERGIKLVDEVIAYRLANESAYRTANALNSRGLLYARRIRGSGADNIEEAIASYQRALLGYAAAVFPRERAGALNNLAMVLRDRRLGDPARHEDEALQALQQALKIYGREQDPLSWAGTMANIGAAYFERVSGDRQQNIEDAIAAYEAALEVRSETATPWAWGATQYNLGQALWRRRAGDRQTTLRAALTAIETSLRIRTREREPEAWAASQSMLAVIYDELAVLGDASLATSAVVAGERALEVYDPETFPRETRATANNLAATLLSLGRFREALAAAELAIEAGEILFQAAATDDARELELEDGARLARIATDAALALKLPAAEVFRLYESGRARLLGDWLTASELGAPASIPHDLISRELKQQKLLREAMLEAREVGPTPARLDAVARAAAARLRLQEHWDEIETFPEGSRYVAHRRGESVSAAQLQEWLEAQPGRPGALVFAESNDGPLAFVCRSGEKLKIVQLEASNDEVAVMLSDFDHQVASARQPATNAETWTRIGEALVAPALVELGAVDLLYVIPVGDFHRVPWHASAVDGEPLLSRFPVAYAPSVAAAIRLTEAEQPTPRPDPRMLLISDPTENLPFARQEAADLATALGAAPLEGAAATVGETLARLGRVQWAHFCAHGVYVPDDPLESGIELSDGRLKSRDLMTASTPPVMVVSTCESGKQTLGAGDELWGLARSLLYAGSSTAVLSFWRVADKVTSEMMVSFYRHFDAMDDDNSMPRIAVALRAAMLECREQHPETFLWAPFALLGNPW